MLVVEDDRTLLRALSDTLRDEGFTIAGAPDGEQAVAAFATFDPDVLLLDLTLPDIEASALVAELRDVRELVPIVLMSGWSRARIAAVSEAIGAVASLRKPFDLDVMVATVRGGPCGLGRAT